MSRISLKPLIDFEHKLYRPEKPREIPHSLYPAGFLTALSKNSNYSGRVWPAMDRYNYGTDATDTLVFS
jgi:hypothetical protein